MTLPGVSHPHAFPLAMATVGERVRVAGIRGEKQLAKRLIDMGLSQQCEVAVLQRQPHGDLVLICGETRIALGSGMAHRILVTPT
jgi:ferrous iron transport protein A